MFHCMVKSRISWETIYSWKNTRIIERKIIGDVVIGFIIENFRSVFYFIMIAYLSENGDEIVK